MNVLVTGIDGFVGSHLTNALLTFPEYTIFGTIHKPTSPAIPLQPLHRAVTLIDTDITELESVKAAVSRANPDKIFHLAGQAFVPRSVEDPVTTYRTNIDGTLNLLDAVRTYSEKQKKRCALLIVGSGEVYGDVTPDMLPVSEDIPLRPSNPYAVSKACGDMIARQYRSTYGMEIVVARPFNHLGPGQRDLFVGSAFAKQVVEIKLGLRDRKLFVGNLDPERDFTDARDVVQAYIKLLEKPRPYPVYNICSGQSMAISKLLDILIEMSGINAEIVTDPSRIRKQEIPKIIGDCSRLRQETGWKPIISIRQTLSDILKYWEQMLTSRA
ncbi:MAG: GDP-mannose 4,6-dehydratase [Bacteroidota bacterium]